MSHHQWRYHTLSSRCPPPSPPPSLCPHCPPPGSWPGHPCRSCPHCHQDWSLLDLHPASPRISVFPLLQHCKQSLKVKFYKALYSFCQLPNISGRLRNPLNLFIAMSFSLFLALLSILIMLSFL